MKLQYTVKYLLAISWLVCGFLFSGNMQAATVELANSPLIRTPSTLVRPNVLFVLDDSGSMTWTYLPDAARDFRGSYGYQSSQCNGVYYDPNVTYHAPVTSAVPLLGVPTRYTDASFTAALDDGFNTTTPTRNLNTEFIANRFEGVNSSGTNANTTWESFGSYLNNSGADSLGPYGAVYYQYTGTVTDKDYTSGSAFYNECNTSIANKTVGITKYIGASSALFVRHRLASTMTTTIVVSGSGSSTSAVSGITVNGIQIMNGTSTTAASISSSTLATNIKNKINKNGFSATVSGSTITITGPATAANYAPVITTTGTMSSIVFTTDVFPETNTAKLTNFANWYSFYRTRLLAMKSSAGEAFSKMNDNYRIGFMKISESQPSEYLDTFSGTVRTNWYDKLYSSTFNSVGTPLRSALATAGRYYGKQLSGADPLQYSCQQSFTLLSTDGYWNDTSNPKELDGSTDIDQQDGAANRPFYDGATAGSTTVYYTRKQYQLVKCGGKKSTNVAVSTQNQTGNCTASTSSASCSPTNWKNSGSASTGTCGLSASLPSPNPSASVESDRVTNTIGGASNTLADVAMYYYQTDLRTSSCTGAVRDDGSTGDVCTNDVATTDRDNQTQQHMTTFSIGLGAEGLMKFIPNYENVAGDYTAINNGDNATASVCTWQTAGTVCNWPNTMSSAGVPENIDDLWHAAVNGRGTYFSAKDPTSLATGLSQALAGINTRRGSAAAASSSSLNPVVNNNAAFVASYVNNDWIGNLESRKIDTVTAHTSQTATWCAEDIKASSCATPLVPTTANNSTVYYCETQESTTCSDSGGKNELSGTGSGVTVCKIEMADACTGTFTTVRKDDSLTSSTAMVSDTSDNRRIFTAKVQGATNSLTDFDATFASDNPTYFDATKLSGLSQWSTLTSSQQTVATANILGYLRGQYGYDTNINNLLTVGLGTVDNRLFRERKAILGDILESKPTFNGKSLFKYSYAGYDAFKTTQNAKSSVATGMVYVGANDGMLHAFVASTGVESWAYVPSMVIPNMWKLADNDYHVDGEHRNYVNGTISIADVCTQNCTNTSTAVWKTILVGGLNAGGRGYYALDITNPTSPQLLWEFTTTQGKGIIQDDDLGYSFAKPVIAKKADGTWVVIVTSGYNNVDPGNGNGYLYVLDAGAGTIISKIGTNVNTSGLSVAVGSATYNTSTGALVSSNPSGLSKIAAWNDDPAGNQAGNVYGGDLLGNVWRFDINTPADHASSPDAVIGNGSVQLFATLFSNTSASIPQPVTTAPVLGLIGVNRVIFVATGKFLEDADRSAPAQQSVYALKDNGTYPLVNPRTITGMIKQTLAVDSQDTEKRIIPSPQQVVFNTDRGWYVDLPEGSERVNADGLLTQGVLFFPSLVPTSSACQPSGHGWLNYFDYANGGPVAGYVSQRYDSPIAGISVINISGTSYVQVTEVNKVGPDSGGPPVTGPAGNFSGKRTLWRELIQ
jgi:type IV pilus assembly protein PilY1